MKSEWVPVRVQADPKRQPRRDDSGANSSLYTGTEEKDASGQWVPEWVQVGSEWAPLRKVAKSRPRDVARTIRTCVLLRTGRACFGVLRRCIYTPSPRGRQPKSPGSIRDAFSKRFRRLPRQCVIQGPSQRVQEAFAMPFPIAFGALPPGSLSTRSCFGIRLWPGPHP